jgi:hypothetical protein|nr:MAG: hypothetical protein KatS3mg041_1100 [Bacteroidota bacterium]
MTPGALARRLLEHLYFVEPYERLWRELEEPEPVVRDELLRLVQARWVRVYAWDPDAHAYRPTDVFDADHLQAYAFQISGTGMRVLRAGYAISDPDRNP